MPIVRRLRRRLYKATHPVRGEVWMLHRLVLQPSTDPQLRPLEATPRWLETLIGAYRRRGYTFVPLGQWPQRGRWVCLTFDDGYADNLTLGLPLMQRLDVPFAVYVSTAFVGNRAPMWWYPGQQLGLDADQLLALDRHPLCTIGAHTVSHPHLDTLGPQAQRDEIVGGKRELEGLIGHPVQHFSMPHGAYNSATIDLCREAGFRTCAMAWGGPVRRGWQPPLLPRVDALRSYPDPCAIK